MPQFKYWPWLVASLTLIVFVTVIWRTIRLEDKRINMVETVQTPIPIPSISPELATRLFQAKDVPQNSIFDFSASIPDHWRAEYMASIEALNIYDPTLPGDSNIEKSVIFLRHFNGSTFLTLPTVTIHEQNETLVANHPAMRYVIEKKSSTPNFDNQPSWRNYRHTVTDVRTSDINPSRFYVIAERPGMTAEYLQFLRTFQF